MRRTLTLLIIAGLLVVALVTIAACGGDGDGGLSVLDEGATTPGVTGSLSPTVPASPATSAEPTPVMSGEGEDPFDDAGAEATAADLEAYLTEVKPIYREIVRIEKIAGAMLVEVSAVADDSWDVAAARTEDFAGQVEMQESLWLDVTPPNGLQEAHQAQATALATEVEMLRLLASQLRSRTWDVVEGTKDVNRLSKEAQGDRETYRTGLETMAAQLGVPVPWKWPAW